MMELDTTCEEVTDNPSKQTVQKVHNNENDVSNKTNEAYLRTYNNLEIWKKSNNMTGWSEDVLLMYFEDVKKLYSPITMNAIFTRLQLMMKKYHKINIDCYDKVMKFLKQNEQGYKAKKTSFFKANEIQKFIETAPDYIYLPQKVS